VWSVLPVKFHPILDGARAVVLDAVGTLIHPHPPAAQVYAEVGRRHGSRLTLEDIATRFAAAFHREEARDRLPPAWQTSEEREFERWRSIVRSVFEDVPGGSECFRELFAHFGRPEAWRCEPEVGEVLTALSEGGWSLAVASNYDRRLHTVATGLAPLRMIPERIISSEVGWRKPAAEFFREAARGLALSPEQIVFVGDDRTNDYDGATGAGMRAILLDPRGRETASHVLRIACLRDLVE
jgi:putative hydrolase of the HAD superfamily